MKKYLLSILTIIICLFGMNTVHAASMSTITLNGEHNYDYSKEVLNIVNEERSKNNLPALTIDEELTEKAMERAREIAVYYDHNRPNGQNCWSILPSKYLVNVGENIAVGYESPTLVMDGWMNSPGHRANILNDEFKSIGIGHYYNGYYHYWVQLFSAAEATPVELSGVKQSTNDQVSVLDSLLRISVRWKNVSELENLISLEPGETLSPTVLHTNSEWAYAKIEIASSDLQWESSNDLVFTVDENGKITAVGGGKATLTATIGEITQEFKVSVKGESLVAGDLDNDGEVSLVDAYLTLKAYLRKLPSDEYISKIDINKNNKIDYTDVIYIIKQALDME